MPKIDCIYFVWPEQERYFSEHGMCLLDGQVPAYTHCLKYDPESENLKRESTGAWDCSDRDPIQDLIDTFWTENPKSCLEKYGNKIVKSMIPEERWPEECPEP